MKTRKRDTMPHKNKDEAAAWRKKHYAEHKEEINARGKKYRAEHKEEIAAQKKKYAAEHREETRLHMKKYNAEHVEERSAYNKKWDAKHRLARDYGITRVDWDAMYTAQGGKCAICGGPPKGMHNKFHVDHDHDTGKVRGLLCSNCNTGIGLMQDNTEILASAISYLKGYQS